MMAAQGGLAVYTIGHSTRPIEEFIALLRAQGIQTLMDVRTVPRSRRNPQYEQDRLPGSLAAAGIAYVHEPGLGGLRKPRPDSPNAGWHNESFRGYADYMQTTGFTQALERLLACARGERVALMCAEAVPWRCHRSLIGDALLARGVTVLDVMDARAPVPHRLTPFARVDGERVTYPALL